MIDLANEEPWPDEVRRAMARFKQGYLIEAPPFAYHANPRFGAWGPTRMLDGDVSATELLILDSEDPAAPPYGIITTQTCDLDEQAPKPKQPWIQVAPVYDMGEVLDGGRQRQVERYEIGYLVKLNASSLPQGFWVADLRIQFPLEKSCLVGRRPIEGFAQETDYLRFADHLAKRVGRPALANVLSGVVVQSLRKTFGKLKPGEKEQLLPLVEELLLEINPTIERPQSARLIVITGSDVAPDVVRDWFDRWHDAAKGDAQKEGLLLLRNSYATLDSLTAREYRHAVLLDFQYLSPQDD